MDIDPKLGISTIKFTDNMKLKKKEDQRVGAPVLLRLGGQNTHRSKYGEKVWSRDLRKGHPETIPPGNSTHIQSPNPTLFGCQEMLTEKSLI